MAAYGGGSGAYLLPSFPFSLVLTALRVLHMLPVLQRLGDAYGFQFHIQFVNGLCSNLLLCMFAICLQQ